MLRDEPMFPPRYMVDTYRQAYASVHGRDPSVRYMGNHWYSVNGETVHRATLMEEITRLRDLSEQARRPRWQDKGVINRLISKLRGL
ncbi:hypothetical protein FBR02_19105 [Anaerolineae bacterium CFX9]|jgi:hypothetical protein|nr:hypothetical protein [Oscillatoria laete-virens]MDK3158909.1 hypothetical protein [Kamptonema cortianum]MDL1902863.1 hypothetical protein [Anaerolineae bacterium CFX9]MDL5052855.1 hypothetical protein [Oscillatoria laete-virens NRMC-F 0139]